MASIDDVLPRFDFRERHSATIGAPAGVILDYAARYRAQDDPLVRAAIRLREWPARRLRLSNRPPLDVDDFTPLGRDGDRALAFGLIGAFWKADYGLLEIPSADAFRANGRTDVCTLVMGFSVQSALTGRSELTTETRVFCPTPAVRRRFAPYWYLIRPVSGLIRRRMLARIGKQAEGMTVEQHETGAS